jgi:uncharacterized protein (TIGR00255 family)
MEAGSTGACTSFSSRRTANGSCLVGQAFSPAGGSGGFPGGAGGLAGDGAAPAVTIRSMTGFARVKKSVSEAEIILSVKSVNHRGLDMHFHMSPELDAIEADLRNLLKQGVARGHLQIHVVLNRFPAGGGTAPLNRTLLEAYLRAFHEAAEKHGLRGVPDLNAALRIPGMLTASEDREPGEEVSKALLDAAGEAIVALNAAREREGAATANEVSERCRSIRTLVERMMAIRAGAVPAFQNRLRERLAELLGGAGLDSQRLAQEAAILADRSDISEELLRLGTHTSQLEQMLSVGGEVGKRMDFLLQEMNREANTVLSKTGGLGDLGLTITDLALAAKSEIDKIREQALNLE